MDASAIFNKVIESATRYGARNPQQYKLLVAQLKKYAPEAVFDGLLQVFSEGPSEFEVQELAGVLLKEVAPVSSFDLEAALLSVKENYNLSVEQLPFHLVKIHGKDATTIAIKRLLSVTQSEKSRRSLETMLWWIKGNEDSAEKPA
jgi:hypothetical protein